MDMKIGGKIHSPQVKTLNYIATIARIDLTQKIHHKINNSSSFSINSQFSTTSDIHRYDKLNDVSNGNPKYESWYYGPQKRVF